MTDHRLRNKPRLNYYEPEEPSFDEFIFCEQCADYVFEYCAIHGPIVVIPDDKVTSKPKYPSFVPRAALTIPHVFLHLARSIIPGAGIGVFSTVTLPRGVRFGPYVGQRTEAVDSMYSWQIYDSNNKRSHVIDAADPTRSNWMRYVNCSRHWTEQNLIAYQYKGQLYYRTIKIIPRFTELLVFYGSEFANVLHINLSKYNLVPYYQQVIGPAKSKIDLQISTSEPMITEIENDEETTNSDALFNFNYEIIDLKSTMQADDSLQKKTLFINDTDFSNAQVTIENNQRFECDQCHKTFLKKKYLKTHSFSHLKIQKFQCTECSFSTSFNYNFKRHSLSHKKNMSSYKTAKTSSDSKTNNSYYRYTRQCEMCSFNTMSKGSFRIHMLKHKGNVYHCQFCEYSTYNKQNLRKHNKRQHSK